MRIILEVRYVASTPRWKDSKFECLVVSVQDRWGPVTRRLEQSPALCVLDAPSPRGGVQDP